MTRRHAPEFWAGKRVLLTGHTGFKGSWLTTYLRSIGAEVHGVSLAGSVATPSLWDQLGLTGITETRTDLDGSGWQADAIAFGPQVVVHLAAQSLVSRGHLDPLETFRTNVMGTARVLEFVQSAPDLEAVLVITTDKVYDPRQPPPHSELHFLGGADPYSASKAAAELVTQSWPSIPSCVATARAGNVIGGGDWSDDRLLPDLVRAWTADRALVLRRPHGVRPWQHVIEPLIGYLTYCEALAAGADVPRALNFGPAASGTATVEKLVAHAAETWRSLTHGPRPAWSVQGSPGFHETDTLVLDSSAAVQALGISGTWGWQEAVDLTLQWYASVAEGARPGPLILEQFAQYLDTPVPPRAD